MKIRNKRGFSLIELLASVLIVAILVAIALPFYERAITRSRTAEVNNLLTMVRTRQVKKFAQDRRYANEFTDPALKKIALGPSDYEENNGNKKFVNGNYELELIDNTVTDPETNQPIVQRCVIGRYRPNKGQAQFAFAIAYDKSGLACDDSESNNAYSKKVCDMFGTVVGSVDSLCAGQLPGLPDLCPNISCGPCEWLDPDTCQCKDQEPLTYQPNYIFDKTNPSCQSCQYYECDNDECSRPAPFVPVRKVVNTYTHQYEAVPEIGDQEFTCNDVDATLGDNRMDEVQTNYYAHCHSAYYKIWDTAACEWKCSKTEMPSDFCKPGEKWSPKLCKCICDEGCDCHPSQNLSMNDRCECKDENQNEVINLGRDEGCVCKGTPPFFWEGRQDRVFTVDYQHCICNESRAPVFFGMVSDRQGGYHTISSVLSNQEGLAEQGYEWKAACCLKGSSSDSSIPRDLWFASELPDFDYDACCPHTNYKFNEGNSTQTRDEHIQFNGHNKECCTENELFYNSSSNSQQVHDPNSQYQSARVAGTYEAKICHKCENWQQAYNSEVGCYNCPGKTFTTWNSSEHVSECSCPTGTTGNVTIVNGVIDENCSCTKPNTYWEKNIAFVNYTGNQGIGPDYSTVWHAHNGACQCNANMIDTYWGLQLTPNYINAANPDVSGIETVSNDDGYCCPGPLATGVYNDNNQVVSGQKACCPRNRRFFHNTTYASNTCGVCQNQTDTYFNGTCQPCPGNMVPVYNTSLGYAECRCPQGMHVNNKVANPLNTLTDTCVCDIANATWQAPSGWVSNYINYAITNTTNTMPGDWDSVNGYCKCNDGYELARYGFLHTQTGTVTGDEVPNTGYCCPEGQCHTAVGNSYAQDTRYCCDSDVEFNSEPNKANCCTAPAATHYYSLADLASAGLTVAGRAEGDASASVATVGGCARCDDPKKDANCELCGMTSKTQVPRVPVWNNNTNDGYSICKCPAGTTETQPSWWQDFLRFLHILSWDPDCYCTAENSTWQDGQCKCHQDFNYHTAEDGESYCCPKATPIYAVSPNKTHKCCQESKPYLHDDNQCHDCPADRPYRYHIGGDDTVIEKPTDPFTRVGGTVRTFEEVKTENNGAPNIDDCHACPQDRPYQYGSTCCPNEVSGSAAYYNTAHGVCSVCSGNDVLINGVCHPYGGSGSTNPCGDEQGLVVQWNSGLNANVCHCTNGAIYSAEPVEDQNGNLTHCPVGQCETIGNTGTQCGCTICSADNQDDPEDTYNLSWHYGEGGGFGGGNGYCYCPQPRVINSDCCARPHIPGTKCCVCPNNSTETPYVANSSIAPQGCCANINVAPNGSGQYCCGRVDMNNDNSLHIAANLSNNTCCTASAPYYYSVKQDCARCSDAEHQYWNGMYCVNCPSGRIIGKWIDHAFTTCTCPVGTSETGAGGIVPNTNDTNHTTYKPPCKCLLAGTVWSEQEQKCVCSSSGYTAVYENDGVTVSSCCLNAQVLNTNPKSCCATGTQPSTLGSTNQCCPTPTTLYDYGSNNGGIKCARCSANQYWTGSQCASCPNGTVPSNWNNQYHAYISCTCPSGTVTTTAQDGNRIQNMGGQYSTVSGTRRTYCKCSNDYHYTDNNYVLTSWSNGTTASCKACPGQSEWINNRCGCYRGYTFVPNGHGTSGTYCACNKRTFLSFNVMSECSNNGAYERGSSCVCQNCPTGTCANSINPNSGCKCENYVYSGFNSAHSINSSVVVEYSSTHTSVYNDLGTAVNGDHMGYCSFTCLSGDEALDVYNNVVSCPLQCQGGIGGGKPDENLDCSSEGAIDRC